MEILLFAVITALVYIVGDILMIYFSKLKPDFFAEAGLNKIIKRSATVGVLNIAAIILCRLFVMNFTFVDTDISMTAVALTAIFCFVSFVAARYINSDKSRKILKHLALLLIIPFILEIFLFNAKSITFDKQQFSPTLSSFTTGSPSAVKISDSAITYSKAGSADITVERSDINAAKISFAGAGVFNCQVKIIDENFTVTPISVGEKPVSKDHTCTFVFSPYKMLHTLSISMTDKDIISPVSITGVELLSAAPFEFSLVRFLLLSAAAVIIYLICRLGLYKLVYDRKNAVHKSVVFAALMLCLMSAFLFISPNQNAISYKDASIPDCDQYVQTFDAVYNGRANLDIPISSSLSAIKNPYDSLLRSRNNVSFAWDRAYYNGQYYSYFGVVPVLLFYFPFYFVTDKLPTLNMTTFFFSALAIIFLFGAVMTAVKKFIKRPNMLILVIGLITAASASGIFYSLNFSDIYFAAVISSMSFLFLCLWTGLAAYKQKSAKKQTALLFVCGLSFILCVGCRPTMALSALILAPVFLYILISREYSLSRKISCLSSFLAPIIIGAAALMWYNYIRFDSPFEFGSSYQLTVSNMQANSIDLRDFPSAVIQYFFQLPEFTPSFPHISLSSSVALANYGHYVYCNTPLSLLSFPSIVIAIVLLPLVLKSQRRSAKRLGAESRVKYFTLLLIFVLSVIIIWLDFCLAGTAIRYLLDILPILTILSILVFLECNSRLSAIPSIQHKGTLLFTASMAATCVIVFLFMLTFESQILAARFPNILPDTQRLVEFWC